MKSWYDLKEEEKEKYIKEFRNKYSDSNGEKLHSINEWLLFPIFLISIFIIMRIIAKTVNTMVITLMIILFILIFLYAFNAIKISKENKDFNNWLKTKNIMK